MKKNASFMLYGESSFLNRGCEAIVNTTINKIKKISEGNIVLSTNDIEYDSRFYGDIITKFVHGYYKDSELSEEEKKLIDYYKTQPFNYLNFEKFHVKDSLSCIDDVDVCLSVGGDNYCYGEPNWLYTINKYIKNKGKKNVLWCTSLFENIESDEMIRDLRTYDVIIARESITYRALERVIDKERLMLSPDTAFSLKTKEIELPQIFYEGKNVIGINISPLIMEYTENGENVINSIKDLINNILSTTDNNICLIPHVYIENNNDLDSLREIKKDYENESRVKLLDEKIYDCEEIKYVISKCSLLIAARTHASIAGYSTNVPTLVIGYSVKSKGIALDLFDDYKNYVIPVNELTGENLIEKYNYIATNSNIIRKILRAKSKILKEEADNQLEKLMEKLEYLEKKYITNKSLCTGCMACYNICPKNAIKKQIENGFYYPKIDKEMCIGCNKCRNICPINKSYKNKESEKEYYAAKNRNDYDRFKSSSGGLIVSFSRKILKKGGVVYGVSLENNKAKHVRIDDESCLDKILGSKYVQSDVESIYGLVRKDLENNIDVLFTGTPCQIEGLKSYLGKEYKKLYCISIICHGVPSPGTYEKYLKEKELEYGKIIDVEFRNKENGWHNFCMKYIQKDKAELVEFSKDIYMKGFLKNYFLRESCYNCQTKFFDKNNADIVIGDYWGIEKVDSDFDDDKGVSAVIINTDKGSSLFNLIADEIIFKTTTYEDIVRDNPSLETSVKYNKDREKFFELEKKINIEEIIKLLLAPVFESRVNQLENDNKVLNSQILDLLEAKKYFLEQIEARDRCIEEKEKYIQDKDKELNDIYTSRSWKFVKKISNIIKK